ncbi:hypothetical protein V1522DRAFT_411198 [Lipomyces starkeyi]
MEHLTEPNVEVLICLAPSAAADNANSHPLDDDWIGALTLKAPLSREEFEYLFMSPEITIDHETRWQLYNLYTGPEHRGLGVASMLFKAAMDLAFTTEQNPVKSKVLLGYGEAGRPGPKRFTRGISKIWIHRGEKVYPSRGPHHDW